MCMGKKESRCRVRRTRLPNWVRKSRRASARCVLVTCSSSAMTERASITSPSTPVTIASFTRRRAVAACGTTCWARDRGGNGSRIISSRRAASLPKGARGHTLGGTIHATRARSTHPIAHRAPIARGARDPTRRSIVQQDAKMRVYTTLPTTALLALLVAPGAAHAQLRRFPSTSSSDQGVTRRASAGDADADAARMLLGLTLGTSGTDRDTLGLLVTQVLRDGPADRAGIDEGNRVAEIDGVSLRLDPVDIGRQGAIDAVMRRLSRTLRGLQGGEQAALRVFAAGKFKNANVQLGNAGSAPNAGGAVVVTLPPASAPVSAPTPAAVSVAGEPASRATTLTGAVQTLTDLQSQLRRLADDEGSTALADTLLQAARDIGAIQRRLRAAQADQQRRRAPDDNFDRSSSRRGANTSST